MDTSLPTSFAHRAKRVIVWAMIISFGAAALGGIVVLLGDLWSETASQVLSTTALTGIISVAVFCGATLLDRPGQWFGIVTIVIAVGTLALLLAPLWIDAFAAVFDWNWSLTACLLTACTAVSSLFLLLVGHGSWAVSLARALTLGLLAVSVVLTVVLIWVEAAFDLEWLTRLTGILWILTALGVIVVPVASLLLRRTPARNDPAPEADPVLSPTTMHRIDAAARAAGLTPDDLIDRLLDPQRPES